MTCRFVLAALLCAASPAISHAAPFTARLKLADGSPAAAFTVSIVGSAIAATSSSDGSVSIADAPAPPFELVVISPDGELSSAFTIDAESAEPIELSIQPHVAETITVVSGVAAGIDRLPANAPSTITAEAIAQRPIPKLALALESIAGAGKLDGGADGVPSLRGLARGRTVVLIDGARVSAERRAGPSATYLDPAAVGALEVVRGPGSVIYGSDAFGGVLNAVTRDPEPGGFHLLYQAESFSQGLEQESGYVAFSGDVAGGSFLVDAHAAEADDWSDGNGDEVYSSGFESAGASLRYVRPVGSGNLRFSVLVDRGENVDKPAIDSRANTASYPTEDSDRFQLGWIGRGPWGWDELDALLFVGTYRLVLNRERQPNETTTRRLDTSDVDADDAQVRVVSARELGGGRFQLGLDYLQRTGLHAIFDRTTYLLEDPDSVDRFVRTISVDDAEQQTGALFATWDRGLGDRTTLALGLRGDEVRTENSGGFYGDRSEDASAISGNLSLSFALAPRWTLVGQIVRGFRVPTLSDRYFVGPSGRGIVVGNPDLEEETSLQADFALRYGAAGRRFALYAYRYEIEDLVERYTDGNDFRFRNRGEAELTGVEAEGQFDIGESWQADFGAAWSDGEADGRDPLADNSAPNGWFGARWAKGDGYVHARATIVLDKDDPGPAERSRPSYELFDLGGGYRFHEAFELRVLVRNVTDEFYIAAADELAAPSPGRTLQVGVSGRF